MIRDAELLPVRKWTKAALRAYACDNTVAQIDESLQDWKVKAERNIRYGREVVRLLEARDVLGVIVAMAEQKMKKSPF